MNHSGANTLWRRILIYAAVAVLMIWTLAPVAWMGLSSLVPGREMLQESRILPEEVTLDRYRLLVLGEQIEGEAVNAQAQSEVFRRAMVNSVAVAGVTTVVSIFVGALAGFAFARLAFPGRKAMLFAVLFFQFLPPIALLLPYYIMAGRLGALDRLTTLIVVNTNFVLAYVIWVLNGYFQSVPGEIENAARIDGCSWFGAFFRVIVPTAKPGFVAVGALSFLMGWDEFLYALVFTQSNNAKTIPVAVSEFGTKFGVDYGMMMTGGVAAMAVPLILALIFQKYIVSGLTAGAVKG